MSSKKLILLCARTARSAAYIQALANTNVTPDLIVIYGGEQSAICSKRNLSVQDLGPLFCPDVTEDILITLQRLGWNHQICPEKELSSLELLNLLKNAAPDLLVYSGLGGQLVPNEVLAISPVLHIHSGGLPEYRGSTTLYHQILEQGHCAASAILLDEKIDTGPMLACKYYDIPPAGLDVDYLYDNVIRADLLVDVIADWICSNQAVVVQEQQIEMPPYFIIHPLLKHLSLLTIDAQEQKYG